MSSPATPPPLPPEPSHGGPQAGGQWAYPTNEKGEPKKKYVLWIVIGAAGCFGMIVLVGVLATIFVPRVIRKLGDARRSAVRAELRDLRVRIEEYALAHDGRYPDSLDALALSEPARDIWGHALVYEPPTHENSQARVYSLGQDGKPGGTGEDADIHETLDPELGR